MFSFTQSSGASFASNVKVGISTSLAILLHELPHEWGDYTILLASGLSKFRAAILTILANVKMMKKAFEIL